MKRALGLGAVALAVGLAAGVWAGLRVRPSPAGVASPFETGLALVLTGTILLGLWVWYRAAPGSGDAMAMPTMVFASASMLIGLLPRVLWPGAERVQIAALLASAVATTSLMVVQIRRYRRRTARRV
jgi:hypothetical protein